MKNKYWQYRYGNLRKFKWKKGKVLILSNDIILLYYYNGGEKYGNS